MTNSAVSSKTDVHFGTSKSGLSDSCNHIPAQQGDILMPPASILAGFLTCHHRRSTCNFSQKAAQMVSWFGLSQQQRTTQPLNRPFPQQGGEENGKKKAKLVGQNKDSLTEQQRTQTLTAIILIERLYKTKGIHRATLSPPNAQHASRR